MSALRTAADRAARPGALALPRPDRKLETEKAADRIRQHVADAQDRGPAEPWDDFLIRIGLIDG